MSKKKYLNSEGLVTYDTKIKEFIGKTNYTKEAVNEFIDVINQEIIGQYAYPFNANIVVWNSTEEPEVTKPEGLNNGFYGDIYFISVPGFRAACTGISRAAINGTLWRREAQTTGMGSTITWRQIGTLNSPNLRVLSNASKNPESIWYRWETDLLFDDVQNEEGKVRLKIADVGPIAKDDRYKNLVADSDYSFSLIQGEVVGWNELKGSIPSVTEGTDKIKELYIEEYTPDINLYTQEQIDEKLAFKESVIEVVDQSNTAILTPEINRYYRFRNSVGTLSIVLPEVSDTKLMKNIVISFTTNNTPAISISSQDDTPIKYFVGYSIEAASTYELNIMYNGVNWTVAYGKIS